MDPKQGFFAIIVVGSQGNYCREMPKEVCEGNFGGTFFRHGDSRSARNGCHGAAGLGYFRLRYLGWRPAILISRLLAAGLG